jgi:hypothetical protein
MFVALSLFSLCTSTNPVAPQAAPGAQAAGVPLAVLPLRSEGLQLNVAQRLDGLIRARGAAVGGYRVQTAEETTALLEAAQALGVTCDLGSPECGAQIGTVAAVDRVVVGRAATVAPFGDLAGGVGLELTLVDANTRAVVRRAIALLPDEPAAQSAAFAGVARVLFAADGAAPWLVVNGGAPGARVVVDGIDVGALPLPRPIAGVVAGPHVVRVAAPGFLPWADTVTTAGVDPSTVDVALVVDPASLRAVVSPAQIAVAWTAAGVGAAVAVAGAVATGVGAQPWFAFDAAVSELDALKPDDDDFVGRARDLHDKAAAAEGEWAAWGSPVTAVGVGGVGVGVVAAVGGAVWAMMLSSSNEPVAATAQSGSPSATTTTR